MRDCRSRLVASMFLGVSFIAAPASAQKKYDAGATDTEIKIGNIMPYSGPASAYSVIGKIQAAYFNKINEEGGINGRKIKFITYDDGYSPPKAVEQARKLVEGDEVLFIFSPMGTPSNSAIQKYMNAKNVPQLFPASYSAKWSDPAKFPWTMALGTSYRNESTIYAAYILKEKPEGKIGVLYQNDDFGKEMLNGLRAGLGSKSSMIVAEVSYEVTDPTIDSQIVKLRYSGADIMFNMATPKFVAQGIKKIAELGWSPMHFIPNVASSVGTVIVPAGVDSAQGILSGTFIKDASDPQWNNDPGMQNYLKFLAQYMPETNKADSLLVHGYLGAQAMVQILKQCGEDLTRENVMKQSANLKEFNSDVLIPGIRMNTSATDFAPLKDMQMMRFKGNRWEPFGSVIRGGGKD
jgi:branched-chain amino acid transport system substrate-binding protein